MLFSNESIMGNKVYLRPITNMDTKYILSWRNSDFVRHNFIWRETLTEEIQEKWLKEKIGSGAVHQFIICSKNDDAPIGSVYLQNFDAANGSAESGIFLDKNIAGGGIGTEAYNLLLSYAFDTLNLHKVKARILKYNEASIHLHKRIGYSMEACLKEELLIDGKYEDLLLFGVLKRQWKEKELQL